MYVIAHAHLLAQSRRDASHRYRAAAASGFEVWMQTLPPDSRSAVQRHDGELVGVVHSGSGRLLIDGGPQRFQAPCTLAVPAGSDFQVVNDTTAPLQMTLVCTRLPVDVDPRAT